MHTTALVLIDIQNDYFPGGRFALPSATKAGENARLALEFFRRSNRPVIHIRHVSTHPGAKFFLPDSDGADINPIVAPINGEKVILKHRPNSFLGTELEAVLADLGIETLAVAGMMTNMCVDAFVRAAADKGFKCLLVHDACAAADLAFGGVDVPADMVHAAFVAALGYAYAQVVSCEELRSSLNLAD